MRSIFADFRGYLIFKNQIMPNPFTKVLEYNPSEALESTYSVLRRAGEF